MLREERNKHCVQVIKVLAVLEAKIAAKVLIVFQVRAMCTHVYMSHVTVHYGST